MLYFTPYTDSYLYYPTNRTGFTISYTVTKREQKTISCPYMIMISSFALDL